MPRNSPGFLLGIVESRIPKEKPGKSLFKILFVEKCEGIYSEF